MVEMAMIVLLVWVALGWMSFLWTVRNPSMLYPLLPPLCTHTHPRVVILEMNSRVFVTTPKDCRAARQAMARSPSPRLTHCTSPVPPRSRSQWFAKARRQATQELLDISKSRLNRLLPSHAKGATASETNLDALSDAEVREISADRGSCEVRFKR